MKLLTLALCVCLAGCTTTIRFGFGPNTDKPEIDFSASAAQLVDVLIALDEADMLDFIRDNMKDVQFTDPLKTEESAF